MPAEPSSTVRLFRVAHVPGDRQRLPYVLEVPATGEGPVRLACAVPWPEGRDAFCLPIASWPDNAQVVLETPVESCRRHGAAIHLVLRRRQRRRSTFVWVERRDQTVVYWRTPSTMSAARPGLKVPAARGLETPLVIAVDARERYAWRFPGQAATCVRRELPVGDYGILDGDTLLAALERKSAPQMATDAVGGKLGFALTELERLPRACLVIEGRLSDVLKAAGEHVRPGWLLSVLAALQAGHPAVPWVFADTRGLAQEYAFRWLAASRAEALRELRAPGIGEERTTARYQAAEPDRGAVRFVQGRLPVPLVDRDARLSGALDEARRGRVWTSRDYAAHFGVSRETAWLDLRRLVGEGRLVAEGERRSRTYRAPE